MTGSQLRVEERERKSMGKAWRERGEREGKGKGCTRFVEEERKVMGRIRLKNN